MSTTRTPSVHREELPPYQVKRSLSLKLGALVILVLILSTLTLGAVGYLVAEDLVQDQIHQRLLAVTSDRHKMVLNYVEQQKERIALVASRTQLRRQLEKYLEKAISQEELVFTTQPILVDANRSTGAFQSIWITDRQGRVITATHDHLLRQDFSKHPDFLVGRSRRHLGEPQPDLSSNGSIAYLTGPVLTNENRPLGVMMVKLDISPLQQILSDSNGMGATGEVLIARREGEQIRYLFSPPNRPFPVVPAELVKPMARSLDGESGFQVAVYDGEEVLILYQPIPYQPIEQQAWGMVAKISTEEAYAPIRSLRFIWVLLTLGLLIAGFIFSLWSARGVVRPLRALTQIATRVASGERKIQVHVDSKDEIGALASAFNQMSVRVAEAEGQLEQRVEERTHELQMEIVQREATQKELEEAKKQAEAANDAKSLFLANMSHELRTPMNGVLGFVELLADSELDPSQRGHLNLIRESATALLRILNDILDLSRIEHGNLQLAPRAFLLREELEQAHQMAIVLVGEKPIRIRLSVAQNLPNVVKGDSDRLRQVLMNLIGNAVKFTEQGRISIQVTPEGPLPSLEPGVSLTMRFTVSDTGTGIPPEVQSRIFGAYQQADESISKRFGGTGLGLTISKELVQLMGGKIWLESEVNQGSQFHFTVELQVSDELPLPKESHSTRATSNDNLTILLAEDGLINQRVASGLLKNRGHQVIIVENGIQALEAIKKRDVDLVLMDVHMPEMDGIQATEKIREQEKRSGHHVPIIALTASAMQQDREQCSAAGMDGFLSKPISPQMLFQAIESLVTTFGITGSTNDRPASEVDMSSNETGENPLPILNLETARAQIPGGEEGLHEMAELLIMETTKLRGALRTAIEADDAKTVRRMAHTIKGSVDLFGAKRAYQAALEVELLGKAEDLSQVGEKLPVLEKELDLLIAELQKLLEGAEQ